MSGRRQAPGNSALRGGRRRGAVAAVGLALVAPLLSAGAASGQATQPGPTGSPDEAAARRYAADVAWMADDARRGRALGSEELAEAGAWIAERFRAIGLEPAGEEGFRHPFTATVADPEADDPHAAARIPAFNVVGRLSPGSARPLRGAIVLGAHYDHLGMGGQGSLAPDTTAIHNGADDNASGVAALLEAARRLVERRSELRREIWFVAFSAEENGLIGSSNFVREPPPELAPDRIVGMINMDMVGRLRDDRLQVLGGESAREWTDLVEPLCEARRLQCAIGGDGFGASDHSSFFAADVPVLHLFTGTHSEYHRPEDDPELINAAGGVRVAGLAAEIAAALAARPERLTLVKTSEGPARQRMGFRARLGTIPDYAGPADGSPGLLLSDVRPGSPAEEGGLRRGDLIVRLGGADISGIEDFMGVLAEAEPGSEAEVVVVRDGERVTLHVVYGAPE